MRLTEEQTKKLLEYSGRVLIKQLALSMTLAKFKRMYKGEFPPDASGAGSELISRCTAELNLLFERFPDVMKPDYEWIVTV